MKIVAIVFWILFVLVVIISAMRKPLDKPPVEELITWVNGEVVR